MTWLCWPRCWKPTCCTSQFPTNTKKGVKRNGSVQKEFCSNVFAFLSVMKTAVRFRTYKYFRLFRFIGNHEGPRGFFRSIDHFVVTCLDFAAGTDEKKTFVNCDYSTSKFRLFVQTWEHEDPIRQTSINASFLLFNQTPCFLQIISERACRLIYTGPI